MSDEDFWLKCDCGASEHVIRISWEEDEPNWPGYFIIQTFMQKLPLWRRIRNAWSYVVLGKSSNYGHFESTLVERERAWELTQWMIENLETKALADHSNKG